jgi:hypothetical protein
MAPNSCGPHCSYRGPQLLLDETNPLSMDPDCSSWMKRTYRRPLTIAICWIKDSSWLIHPRSLLCV